MVLCILWIPSRVSSSGNKVTPIYDPRDIEQRFEDWLAQYGREYELETNGLTDNKFADITNEEFKFTYLGFWSNRHTAKKINNRLEEERCCDSY
ncbi:hypothetical protein NC651_030708 [Populus alba x Populus x berolinensis]|nr:hypothetical protein NC651_030708 [Populus alba x Populus x berolinensis]